MDYAVSPLALELIKGFEGYSPKPSWDYKQHSVGYGTRWTPGTPIGTRADHEAALGSEAGKVGQWIDANVKVPLTEPQKAALTSFGFNLGTGNLERLLPDINAGNWERVAARMPSFNQAGGQPLAGLTSRRQQEAALITGGGDTIRPEELAWENRNNPNYGKETMPTIAGPGQPTQARPVLPTLAEMPSARENALAQALLESSMSIKPQGWGDALRGLTGMYAGMTMGKKYDEGQKAYRSSLAKALTGATDTDTLTNTMLASGDPEMQKTAIAAKIQAMQPKSQKDRFLSTPQGVFDTQTQKYVTGGAEASASGLGPVAEKERQKAVGKGVGEAQVNLPQALKSGQYMIKSLDEALGDEGLSRVTGQIQGRSWSPNISGTAARAQSRIDQIQGQTFLQAFNALRGGGQITEAEGAKATAALNRLGTQTMSDEDYRKAIMEFRNEVANLYDLAQVKAGIPAEKRERIGTAVPDVAGGGNQPPSIKTEQDYKALPSGARYIAPDGSVRVKP